VLEDVVVEDLVARAAAGAPNVEVDLPDDLPAVRVDVGLTDRVLANLTANALRHAGDKAVELTAGVGAHTVDVRVVDHGPGVPDALKARMFAPFERLGASRGDGVGLGLTVAQGLAEAQGATLTAEDTPGGGLTMVLSLPVTPEGADR
jgi:two-component system sensor histidine kinase KdpD